MIFTREEKGRMDQVFDAIYLERIRQEDLKLAGKFPFTCADIQLGTIAKGLILGEEYGEVCLAILSLDQFTMDTPNNGTTQHLRAELVQVAAVAVAWIESIDKKTERGSGDVKG